jgi:hypothetical protein
MAWDVAQIKSETGGTPSEYPGMNSRLIMGNEASRLGTTQLQSMDRTRWRARVHTSLGR